MLTLLSPAKLNLFLKVVGKRVDGYHDVVTFNQTVGLFDTLTFSLTDGKDKLTCSQPHVPTGEENLIFRAARLFRKKMGISKGISVTLEKEIPIGAGLGGGSSNAATTLWAMNQLFESSVDEAELMRWGGELGADVPFFFSSGTALCEGFGEQVTSFEPLPQKSFWIFQPVQGLSTPVIFDRFRFSQEEVDPQAAVQRLLAGHSTYHNDLEESAVALLPTLGKLKLDLIGQGVQNLTMTGSGSAFYCDRQNRDLRLQKDVVIHTVETTNRLSFSWYEAMGKPLL